jgi:3-dehydroquinate dehydratase II
VKILVCNGPNLDRLGTRQPEIYGSTTLQELEEQMRARATGHELVFVQSADIETLATAITTTDAEAIILNPAALTHYSRALAAAVAACGRPVIEVHISNIAAREPYRRRSMIAPVAKGSIVGLGVNGYLLALDRLLQEAQTP